MPQGGDDVDSDFRRIELYEEACGKGRSERSRTGGSTRATSPTICTACWRGSCRGGIPRSHGTPARTGPGHGRRVVRGDLLTPDQRQLSPRIRQGPAPVRPGQHGSRDPGRVPAAVPADGPRVHPGGCDPRRGVRMAKGRTAGRGASLATPSASCPPSPASWPSSPSSPRSQGRLPRSPQSPPSAPTRWTRRSRSSTPWCRSRPAAALGGSLKTVRIYHQVGNPSTPMSPRRWLPFSTSTRRTSSTLFNCGGRRGGDSVQMAVIVRGGRSSGTSSQRCWSASPCRGCRTRRGPHPRRGPRRGNGCRRRQLEPSVLVLHQ